MNRVYVSFEEDFPSWSDYCLDSSTMENLDKYISDLITAIEWNDNRKVRALKIESVDNHFDPIYRIVNHKGK